MFYNKDGTLTRYALSCGYLEKYSRNDDVVTLEMLGQGFHVRGFIDDTRFAYCGPSLTEARKLYRQYKSRIRQRNK